MIITGLRRESAFARRISYGVTGWKRGVALLVTTTFAFASAQAERINHEGRILAPRPVVTTPTLFNTPQADAVVSAMQIFPVTNPWNEDISRRPVLANSASMIAQIKSDLSSSRQTLRPFYEMNYVLVPDNQARVTVPFVDYPDESDLDGGAYPNGRYPVPSNMPIETWPRETGGLTLQQWQMDAANTGGDRHGIIVASGVGSIWESWQMKLSQSGWQASNGAKFNLNSNALRPATWTSGDAAGLPMFPALVRYDECQRGMVEHALRLVVARTRRQYIYPATHYASSIPATSTNYPAMGQRLRLKSNFVIPGTWTIQEKAVLRALKKYGAIVADNGNFFSVSVCPDNRFPANAFDNLSTIDVSNFEVIQTTGPNEGPRSPGAPTVNAGPDQNINAQSAILSADVVNPSGNAVLQWRLYSGPAAVTIANPNSSYTMVNFNRSGSYRFLFSANDAVHAVAYDAVVVNVQGASPTPAPTATPRPTPAPTPSPATVPTITVSVSPTWVSEGRYALFTVSTSAVMSRPITVIYSMGGTARQGSDYTLGGTPGKITIPAGRRSATVVLRALVDNAHENYEGAVMKLSNGAGYRLPSEARARVAIVDPR